MADQRDTHTALGDVAARQLANATKTVPQLSSISPRWLTHLLQWVPVEAGIYRVNRVKDSSAVEVDCSARDERVLPQTFVDYVENPREYMLTAVTRGLLPEHALTVTRRRGRRGAPVVVLRGVVQGYSWISTLVRSTWSSRLMLNVPLTDSRSRLLYVPDQRDRKSVV